MSSKAIQALRALRRAQGTKWEKIQREKFYEADCAFDGGEWSRGFHAKDEDDRDQRLLQAIAPRFDMTPEQLDNARHVAYHEATEHWLSTL